MKKVILMLLTLSTLFIFAACSQPASGGDVGGSGGQSTEAPQRKVSITHELGTVEVPYNPQKVAILDMSVLDMMDAWNLGSRVVGMPKESKVTHLMDYINNDSVKNLGTLKEVDMEALMALEPDVIFIGGRLSKQYDDLSRIAPVVYSSIDQAKGYMNEFKANVQMVASIFGKETETASTFTDFEARIQTLNNAAAGKTAIVGLVTSGSFNTLGKTGRCSIISNEVGFENLANDVDSTHGDTASFELILDKNPDYVFALDRDMAINAEGSKAAKEILENEIVMKADAYKNGKIIYLTPDVWYLAEGGITSTDIMLKDLEKGILG